MRGLKEPLGHQRHNTLPGGYLNTAGGELATRQPPGCSYQPGHLTRPHGGTQVGTQLVADVGQAPVGESADADPVDGFGAADDIHQRPHSRVVFGVDVDPDVGPQAQQVFQQRDGFGPVDTGVAHLGPGEIADDAVPVGHPVEGVIMHDHQDTVGGGVDIGLDVAVAEVDGRLEGRHRVLSRAAIPTRALMGEGQRSGPVEEGETGHQPATLRDSTTRLPSTFS